MTKVFSSDFQELLYSVTDLIAILEQLAYNRVL